MNNYPNIKQLLLDFPSLLSPVQIIKDHQLTGITSTERLTETDIVFCPSIKQVQEAAKQKAGLIIVSTSTAEDNNLLDYKNSNIVKSTSLQESMAKLGQKYFFINNTNFFTEGSVNIHPTAIVDKTAQLHPSVKVGAYSIIEANTKIAEKVCIGAHSVISNDSQVGALTKIGCHNFIGSFVSIGQSNQIAQQVCIEHHSSLKDNNTIHSQVVIGRGSIVHSECEIESHSTIGGDGFGYGSSKEGKHFKKVHFGNVIIKDRVQIGSSTHVDRGTFGSTVINEGTKIDNLCHIAHNVNVGKHCLITAGFSCAGSTIIGNHCVFGGGVAVSGHITVSDNVCIIGKSVITNNVLKPGTYGGFPLQELQKFRRTYAGLTKLSDVIKKVNKLLDKK